MGRHSFLGLLSEHLKFAKRLTTLKFCMNDLTPYFLILMFNCVSMSQTCSIEHMDGSGSLNPAKAMDFTVVFSQYTA